MTDAAGMRALTTAGDRSTPRGPLNQPSLPPKERRPHPSRAALVRTLAAATGLWTLFATWVLLANPGGGALWANVPISLNCIRLIGHSAECEAAWAAVNAEWTRLHILPVLVVVASGYVAIAVVAVVGAVRRRGQAPNGIETTRVTR